MKGSVPCDSRASGKFLFKNKIKKVIKIRTPVAIGPCSPSGLRTSAQSKSINRPRRRPEVAGTAALNAAGLTMFEMSRVWKLARAAKAGEVGGKSADFHVLGEGTSMILFMLISLCKIFAF
jgi:hypothetical protein